MEQIIYEQIQELIENYPHLTDREMAEDLQVDFGGECQEWLSRVREVKEDIKEEWV